LQIFSPITTANIKSIIVKYSIIGHKVKTLVSFFVLSLFEMSIQPITTGGAMQPKLAAIAAETNYLLGLKNRSTKLGLTYLFIIPPLY